MRWFRFYDEVVDDPKCQRLPPALFKHWINILCLSNRSSERGTIPAIADVAFGLRVSESKAKSIIKSLVDAELIDINQDGTLSPHNWNGRQRTSDNVSERVRKHREQASGNENVTLQDDECNVTETPPRARATETEQRQSRTEQKKTQGETSSPGVQPRPIRPPSGPAQELVQAWCDEIGVDRPASYGKAVGQAQRLVDAGILAKDAGDLIAWLREQTWINGAIDLGTMLQNADKWRAANAPKKPKDPNRLERGLARAG